MKMLQVSDEVYEGLKAFIIDPFDDTPNTVLTRLMDIVSKAQSRFCPIVARIEDKIPDSETRAQYTQS